MPAFTVEDIVRGGSGQAAKARLLLHPDVAIERGSGGATLSCGPARARQSPPALL